MRRCDYPTRRGLLGAAAGGVVALGCGPARRPSVFPAPAAPLPTPPPSPPAPRELDRGQILGQGPEEPLAPPGRWVVIHEGRVELWAPRFLEARPDLMPGVLDELEHVVPAYEGLAPHRALHPTWLGVDADPTLPPVAVVIMDPAAYSYTLADVPSRLVAGDTSFAVRRGETWQVLRVAFRPPGGTGPLLPALGRETWRRLTRTA